MQIKIIAILSFILTLQACVHKRENGSAAITPQENFVAAVPKVIESSEIRRGMSQKEVESLLGAPSVVAKDGEQLEIWEYNKIAKNIDAKDKMVAANFAPIPALTMLGVVPRNSDALDSDLPSDRPLSVRIRFDRNSRVDTLSYFISKH